jgi:putative transposase
MTDASGLRRWPLGPAGGVRTGGRGERNDDRHPQRLDCVRTVHLMKNALSYLPKPSLKPQVVASLRAVFDAPDRAEAERQLEIAVKKYRTSAPKLADWLEANVSQGLTIFALPVSHRRRLRTSNMLERLNEEIKRRTRVAGLFPNDASALRLVSAVLMEISEDWETNRKYLTMEPA